jgi:RNA polymerase sigma factor (sigma-70 family)
MELTPRSVATAARQLPSPSTTLGGAQGYLRAWLEQRQPEEALTAAWDGFYQASTHLFRRLATIAGAPPDEVEDVVQNVWADAIRSLLRFSGDGETHLRRWLCRLVRSKAADLFRWKSRHAEQSLEALGMEPAAPEEDDPAVRWEKEWERELLQTILEELRQEEPGLNYRLLQGRHIEGRSVAELAAEEGLTSHEVSCRLHRLLGKLRARLVARFGEDAGPQGGDSPADAGR